MSRCGLKTVVAMRVDVADRENHTVDEPDFISGLEDIANHGLHLQAPELSRTQLKLAYQCGRK